MTAAAVGTCAWATEEQTLLNETFESTWILTDNNWWTYSAGEAADGELTLADGKLSLNTGSKVLTGSFASDKNPVAIGTDGLYFKSTVTFKDPSDTLPTLGAQDKFALVVLDNIESCEKYNTEATPNAVTPATNLWVIAGHGTKGKCAYMLCPDAETLNLNKSWLDSEHEIEVKAYADVLDGDAEAAGFLVMIDNEICTVKKVYDIGTDGVIDFSTGTDVNYLGYESTAIIGSLGLRYSNKQLLISAASGSSLASVDFQGQGVIDNVALATTTEAEFGADAMTLKISATTNVVTDIACDSKAYAETGYIIPANAETVTVTFKLASGYVLSAPENATKVGDVYTYTYTVGEDINQSLTISAFAPAAYVNGEAVSADDFAELFESPFSSDTTIKLNEGLTLDGNPIQIDSGVTLAIDLNGNTITPAEGAPAVVNGGTLVITDSDIQKRGTVAGALIGAGVFNLQAGRYLATDVYPFTDNEENVWKFEELDLANNGFTATLTDDYYVIAAASNYPESENLVDGYTELDDDQKKAVKATFDAIAGEAADADAAVTNYINTVYGATVPVDDLIGAQSVDISVAFNLPLMKTAEPIVEIVAEAVGADDAAAFSFQIEDGEGNPVAIKAAVAKVYDMIRYATDLADLDNGKVAAGNPDVECVVDEGNKKIKVNMKKTQTKGFMKVKLR